MFPKVMIGIVWAGSLALFFFIGFVVQSGSQDEDEGTASQEASGGQSGKTPDGDAERLGKGKSDDSSRDDNDMDSETAILPSNESDPELPPLPVISLANALAEEELEPATADEIREVLGTALVSDNLVERNRAIADMLSRLSPENATVALSVFENTPRAYHTDNNFRLFMHAWGKVDGKAALQYIYKNPDAHAVGGSHLWAMSGWTQSDPAAALDFVTSQENPDHGLYHGLVRGWGRVDLNAANDFVAGLKTDDRELRRRLVSVIGESCVEQLGVEGALEWTTRTAAQSDDQEFASTALSDVLRRAVTQSPSLAAEWISSNPDHPHVKPWMFEHTASRMADKDPQMAAQWLSQNLDHKSLDGRAVGRVASEWAEKDAASAAEWVETLRDTKLFNKELTSQLAGSWAKRDTQAAFDWAESLNTDLRRSAYGSIVGRMPKAQLASAGEWIRKAPADSMMDGARAAYAQRVARDKPNEALEQALLMTDALGRERVAVPIVQRMFKEDPEAFKEWLPKSGLSLPAQQRILRGK